MKKVVISGGAGGIGSEITRKFVKEGYFCYIVDVDREKGNLLAKELGEACCKYLPLDVTSESDMRRLSEQFASDKELCYIVTAAGRPREGEVDGFEKQAYITMRDSIDLNLVGHINAVRSLYPALKRSVCKDKCVVMLSSVNAISAFGLPAYSAAKAGLYGFMNAVAKEFGRSGIRINCVSLGTVKTPAAVQEQKNIDEMLKGCALNGFTTAKEAADGIYAVCSTLTSMTGNNVVLDAGQSKAALI